jgi:hypothetical protein
MDRHGLAGARRLLEEVAEQRAAETPVAPLRQERDVDDVVRAFAAIEIKAADRDAIVLDDEPLRVGKTLPVFAVLGARLRLQKGGRLLFAPLQRGELLGAGRGVDAEEERLIGGFGAAEAEARCGGVRPAERRGLTFDGAGSRTGPAQVRGGYTPCSAMQKLSVR